MAERHSRPSGIYSLADRDPLHAIHLRWRSAFVKANGFAHVNALVAIPSEQFSLCFWSDVWGFLGTFTVLWISAGSVSRLEFPKAVILLLCQMGGGKKYFRCNWQVFLKLWIGSLPSVLGEMQIALTFLSVSWAVNLRLFHLLLEFRNLRCQRCWIYLVPFVFH